MIIRKPYAFLIKNFKKIHITLLVFALYIYFKSTQTYSFVREFISLNSYDIYNEPISKYVNIFGYLLLIILILGSSSLMLLLRKKEKPWKLYLLPTMQYSLILLAFVFIRGYFNNYTGVESTAPLRAWRDLLLVSQFAELGVIVIYLIRVFGIDLNKFNFKFDEEYLELEQSDKEELEININIDKSAFKRTFKRLIRNLNYIYQEHKLLCNIIIVIIVLLLGKNTYSYITSHKSFKEGDTFTVNGYTIKINNSYYTDKSYNGTIISKKSSFVVVDLSVTNNANITRTVNFNKYHVINGVRNYTPTEKTYETEFKDLGNSYDSVSLGSGKTKRLLLIFKVDNKLKKNRFVLYYQELNGSYRNLRKIKLKIKDLSEIKVKEKLNLNETLQLNVLEEEENIIFEYYQIESNVNYSYKNCTTINCTNTTRLYQSPSGYKVLIIAFGSDTFEGNDMSEFVSDYGKIVYKDNENKKKTIDVVNAIDKGYYGKYIYLKVPEEIEVADEISFEFTIRNNKYIYKIL